MTASWNTTFFQLKTLIISNLVIKNNFLPTKFPILKIKIVMAFVLTLKGI